jgi:hypothetical protein
MEEVKEDGAEYENKRLRKCERSKQRLDEFVRVSNNKKIRKYVSSNIWDAFICQINEWDGPSFVTMATAVLSRQWSKGRRRTFRNCTWAAV